MFDSLKNNDEIEEAIGKGIKTIIYGAIIIGAFLFLEKIFDFGFDLSVNLGL